MITQRIGICQIQKDRYLSDPPEEYKNTMELTKLVFLSHVKYIYIYTLSSQIVRIHNITLTFFYRPNTQGHDPPTSAEDSMDGRDRKLTHTDYSLHTLYLK